MSVQMVLLPVFALVGLSFALLLGMGATHTHSHEAGETGLKEIELGPLPLLFYTLIALALPIRHADLVIVLLSWVFVVTRFAHAGIFITSNNDQQRSPAGLAGVLVLCAMWLYFALRIMLSI